MKKFNAKLSQLFRNKSNASKEKNAHAEEDGSGDEEDGVGEVAGGGDESGDEGGGDEDFEDDETRGKVHVLDIVGRFRGFIDDAAKRSAQPVAPGVDPTDGRFITAKEIHEFNMRFLERGPDETVEKKIEQMEVFERLHLRFEAGAMSKCLLSYYLKETFEWRRQLKEMLTNKDAIFLNKNWQMRLSKIPVGWTILADRGFAYDASKYPNFNIIVTPTFVEGRDQFTRGELQRDITKCTLRYISETTFSRVTDEWTLLDVVDYSYFPIVQDICDWAVGAANLCQPFYKPKNY